MSLAFLDTNIFLRHLRQDNAVLSPKATAIFTQIEQGQLQVRTSDTVVFETVFTLQRSYKQPKARIAEGVLSLMELPGILLPGKRRYRKVFQLYVQRNLPFADAYHAVLMESLHLTEILSFDEDFDDLPGITRREG
jgi:predicted nucleic acid-binding protein